MAQLGVSASTAPPASPAPAGGAALVAAEAADGREAGAAAAAGSGAGAASSTPAAPTRTKDDSDFESTDQLPEFGDDGEAAGCDMDAEIAAITSSPADRDKIKELLQRRQVRTARRRSGPKRLKKAGKTRELVGEGPDPKKPAK